MGDLDALLLGEEPVEKPKEKVNFGLDELHISRYAYEKAFRYAKLVLKGRWRSVEVGGFLTKPRDAEDRVARNAFLARNQEVSYTSYELSAEDVLKAKKELEQEGQKIIGWWHSHGRGDTFHSETDNNNQRVLLNQISPSNYITLFKERSYENLQSRVEGNQLVFWNPQNSLIQYILELKDENPELTAQNLRVLEEKRIGFAYSFVVNHHRWLRRRVPYCEIATRDLCLRCKKPKDISVAVEYQIINDGEFEIDENELLKEINDRVHVLGEYKKKKTYYLPATFEEQRATGTLTEPVFSPEVPPKGSYQGAGYRAVHPRTKRRTKDSQEPKDSLEAKKTTFDDFLYKPELSGDENEI